MAAPLAPEQTNTLPYADDPVFADAYETLGYTPKRERQPQAAAQLPEQPAIWRGMFPDAASYHDYFARVPERERDQEHAKLFGGAYYQQPSAHDIEKATAATPIMGIGSGGAGEAYTQATYNLPIAGTVARAIAGVPISEPMKFGGGARLSGGASALRTGVGIAGSLGEIGGMMATGGALAGAAGASAATGGLAGAGRVAAGIAGKALMNPVQAFAIHGAMGARTEGDNWDYTAEALKQAALGAATGGVMRVVGLIPTKTTLGRIGLSATMGAGIGYGGARAGGASHEDAMESALTNAILFPALGEGGRFIRGARDKAAWTKWFKKADIVPSYGPDGKKSYYVIGSKNIKGATVDKVRAGFEALRQTNPELANVLHLEVGKVSGGAAEVVVVPVGPKGEGIQLRLRVDANVAAKASPRRIMQLMGHEAQHAKDVLAKKYRDPVLFKRTGRKQEAAAQRAGSEFAGRGESEKVDLFRRGEAAVGKRGVSRVDTPDILSEGHPSRIGTGKAPTHPRGTPTTYGPSHKPLVDRAMAGRPTQKRLPGRAQAAPPGKPTHGVKVDPADVARLAEARRTPRLLPHTPTPAGKPGTPRRAQRPQSRAAVEQQIGDVRLALHGLLRMKGAVGKGPDPSRYQSDPLLTAPKAGAKGSVKRRWKDIQTLRQELKRMYESHPDSTLGVEGKVRGFAHKAGAKDVLARYGLESSAKAPLTKKEQKALEMTLSGRKKTLPGMKGGVGETAERAIAHIKNSPVADGDAREMSTQALYKHSGAIAEPVALGEAQLKNLNKGMPGWVNQQAGWYLEAKMLGSKRGYINIPGDTGKAIIARFENHPKLGNRPAQVARAMNALNDNALKNYLTDPNSRGINELKHHVQRHWKGEEGRVNDYVSRLPKGPKARFQRKHRSLWDGVDAGLRPKHDSYSADVIEHIRDFATVKAARGLITDMQAIVKKHPGVLMRSDKAPADWKTTEWRFLTAKSTELRPVKAKKGGWRMAKVRPRSIAVHPDVYEPLVSIMSNYKPGAVAKAMAGANAMFRTLKTALSAFHYIALGENWTGGADWFPKGDVRKIRMDDPNYIAELAGYGMNIQNARPLDVVQRGNGLMERLGRHWQTEGALKGGGAKYKIGKALRAVGEKNPIALGSRLLFDVVKPRLMASSFEAHRARYIRKGVGAKEASQLASRRIRNAYGDLRPDFEPNFLGDPKVNATMRGLWFSWAWSSGAIRQGLDAVPQKWFEGAGKVFGKIPGPIGKVGKFVAHSAKTGVIGGPKTPGGVYVKDSGVYLAKMATLGIFGSVLMNLYTTKRDKGKALFPWENPPGKRTDVYLFHNKETNKDIYGHNLKQARELARYITDPVAALHGKSSVPVKMIVEQLSGYSPSMPLIGSGYNYPVQSGGKGKPWGGGSTFAEQIGPRMKQVLGEFEPFASRGARERGSSWWGAAIPTGQGMSSFRASKILADSYRSYLKTGKPQSAADTKAMLKHMKDNGLNPETVATRAKQRVNKNLYDTWWDAVEGGKPSAELMQMMKRAKITKRGLAASYSRRTETGSLDLEKAKAGTAIRGF